MAELKLIMDMGLVVNIAFVEGFFVILGFENTNKLLL